MVNRTHKNFNAFSDDNNNWDIDEFLQSEHLEMFDIVKDINEFSDEEKLSTVYIFISIYINRYRYTYS